MNAHLKNSTISCLLFVVVTLLYGVCCDALNIVVTNDDGFEASTIQALYRVLKAHGHDVLIASETQDNSGRGGALDFFVPIGELSQDSRGGTIKAGAPGVGRSPTDPDIHYVNATPVAAALYGIDVLSFDKWHSAPDLVISGPNYGNNTGLITNQSGTVNAALIAVNRGIPAIAVSTANPAKFRSFELLRDGDPEFEDAELVQRLVAALEAGRRPHRALLPQGLGLNVNFPNFSVGSANALRFCWSTVGSATRYVPIFVRDLSTDPSARAFGMNAAPLPGVSVVDTARESLGHALVADANTGTEEKVLRAGAISVSVIHGNHQATATEFSTVKRLLGPTVVAH